MIAPRAPYDYCPECGTPGFSRERRSNGDDLCENGHKYSSRNALNERQARIVAQGYANKHTPPDEIERRRETETERLLEINRKAGLITAGIGVQLQIRSDGQLVWINVDGVCALRIIVGNDAAIEVKDDRKPHRKSNPDGSTAFNEILDTVLNK